MLHDPSIDQLAKNIGSKYVLCVVASKRARQIIDAAQNQGFTDLPSGEKPLNSNNQKCSFKGHFLHNRGFYDC